MVREQRQYSRINISIGSSNESSGVVKRHEIPSILKGDDNGNNGNGNGNSNTKMSLAEWNNFCDRLEIILSKIRILANTSAAISNQSLVATNLIFLAVLPLCCWKILPIWAPFAVMWIWPIVSYIRRQKPVEDQIEIGWKNIERICQEESFRMKTRRNNNNNVDVSFHLRDGCIDDSGEGYDDYKYIEIVVVERLKTKNSTKSGV